MAGRDAVKVESVGVRSEAGHIEALGAPPLKVDVPLNSVRSRMPRSCSVLSVVQAAILIPRSIVYYDPSRY